MSSSLSGRRRWLALVVLSLTQLVVVLDGTIVNIALPQAQLELGLTDGERGWVVTAYALAFGALLLLGGRIADYWGRKRAFMVGMAGFGAASVIGGMAQTGLELIIARGLQGAFAALLAPAALALLTVTFPSGKERNTAFAVFGTIAGAGAAVGLVLGGALTEFADWRWCLLVNVVFVVVGMIGGGLLLPESRAAGRNRYDWLGAVTIVLGLGSLVFGFSEAERGWANPVTIGCLVAGVALLALFTWRQAKAAQPSTAAADRRRPRAWRRLPDPGRRGKRHDRRDPVPHLPSADRARDVAADRGAREPAAHPRHHRSSAAGHPAALHDRPTPAPGDRTAGRLRGPDLSQRHLGRWVLPHPGIAAARDHRRRDGRDLRPAAEPRPDRRRSA